MSSRGGLRLLEADGSVAWEKYGVPPSEDGSPDRSAEVAGFDVAAPDTDGDAVDELVRAVGFTNLQVLDGTGEVIDSNELSRLEAVQYLAACSWPPGRNSPAILTVGNHELRVYSPAGERLARLEAPDAAMFFPPSVAVVEFDPGQSPWLAVALSAFK